MSQDKEPDVLDLVQEDDDGLAYELYGSLGMFRVFIHTSLC